MENKPEPINPWAPPTPIGAGSSHIPEMFSPEHRILGVEQAKILVVNRLLDITYGKYMPKDELGRSIFEVISAQVEASQVHIQGRTREDAKAMAQAEAGSQPAPMSVNMFTGEKNVK